LFFYHSPFITHPIFFYPVPYFPVRIGDQSTPTVDAIETSIDPEQDFLDFGECTFTHGALHLFSPFFSAKKNKKSV
jgi:hypothetical protein